MKFADRFFHDGDTTAVEQGDSLHRSYQHFVTFFAERSEVTESDLVIGSYFTYGWMPTMLDLRGDLKNTLELVNRVKLDGCRLSSKELMTIALNINGSVVGASKLLHFVRPDIHAIWDSRVYRYLHQKEPHTYRLQKPDAYNEYLDDLQRLQGDCRFPKLKARLKTGIGYEVTDNRISEHVMYYHGSKS